MEIILELLFLSINAKAAELPVCSLDLISNRCSMFAPNKQFVELPNGNVYSNIGYVQPPIQAPQPSFVEPEDPNVVGTERLESQFQAMEILEKSKKPVSEKFKLFASTNFMTVGGGLGLDPSLKTVQVDVYSPIDSESGKLQTLTPLEFQNAMREYYDDSQLKELQEVARVAYQRMLPQKTQSKHKAASIPGVAIVSLQPKSISKDRMNVLILQAQNSIENKIRAGRSDSYLSERELAAIQKVKAIKFIEPPAGNTKCTGTLPNAEYRAEFNNFYVCANTSQLSEASFLGLAAHELAHAIDPCEGNYGLYSVDLEKMKSSKVQMSAEARAQLLANSTVTGTFFAMQVTNGEAVLKQLEKEGVIKRQISDFPADTYPFQNLANCLTTSDGGGFRSMKKSNTTQYLTYLRSIGMADHNVRQVGAVLENNPECVLVDGKNSQLTEATADWFGAQAVADNLKASPTSGQEGPLFFSNISCMENQALENASPFESIQIASNFSLEEHPKTSRRVEDIYLKNPDVANANGCKPKPGGECSLYSKSATNNTNGTTGAIHEQQSE